jgi:hypothetical protein
MAFTPPNEVISSALAVLVMAAAMVVIVLAYCIGALMYVFRRSVATVSLRVSVICGTVGSTLDVGSILSTAMI